MKLKWKYLYVFIFVVFASFLPENSLYENILFKRHLIAHEWEITKKGRERSARLNEFFENNASYPSQGLFIAGGSAFTYKGLTNDLLGLNNAEIAHSPKEQNPSALKNHASFNKDIFFKQQPDLLWYNSTFVDNNDSTIYDKIVLSNFERKIYKDVQNDKRFNQIYRSVVISNKELDYSLKIFASVHFLETIDTLNYHYCEVEYRTFQF